jgi:anti-sigma regulatory factor (Ser/Thr protein kinase)
MHGKGTPVTMRDPKHELALDLPASHRSVRVARNVVRHFARLEGVKDCEIEQLVLVVSELLANAVDHGGGPPAMTEQDLVKDTRMRLLLEVGTHEWRLAVSDEGGGDPARVRHAIRSSQLPDLEDERGRGLYLMRQMVDSMEVDQSADGRGLTFRITRRHARG